MVSSCFGSGRFSVTLDSYVKLDCKSNPVTVYGIEYNSIRAAARALGTTCHHINKYLETGKDIKPAKTTADDKNYYVGDLIFHSRKHAASFFDVSVHNLSSTIKRYKERGILEEVINKIRTEFKDRG